MKKIYLVMAKSRIRETETWNSPYVVYATETKLDAEKDAERFNKEDLIENGVLEFNYFVEECKMYNDLKAEE